MSSYLDIMLNALDTKVPEVPTPKKPVNWEIEYEFPERLDLPTLDELGKWLGYFAQWRGYLFTEISIAESKKRTLKKLLEYISKEVYIDLVRKLVVGKRGADKDLAIEEAKHRIWEDKRILDVSESLEQTESTLIHLLSRVETYSVQYDAISREITRRIEEARALARLDMISNPKSYK